jgi:D-tagatose-1,6-bisphosphate aldolase subunit GatZ/KbaZ
MKWWILSGLAIPSMPDSCTALSTAGAWSDRSGWQLCVDRFRPVLPGVPQPSQHLMKPCSMSHLLDEILRVQKRGEAAGIASICSAHPWVLKTALRGEAPVLIESTCNQVNQFGGYTGMTPADFVGAVRGMAAENDFPFEDILFGGDHLGPSPWQAEASDIAMQKAVDMVRACVQAGYTKIHLDASMKLGDDDPVRRLEPELAARRTARLAKAAEEALPTRSGREGLRYVIGTEVPLPGGAIAGEQGIHVTTVEDAQRTLEGTQAAFIEAGLDSAWERVVAMVVQPGVEYGDDFILDYNPEAARDLRRFSEGTALIYEAHSTDYQTPANLQNLVHDHFAILKVGPALTFAFREAVFALAMIENELIPPAERSNLIKTLDGAMRRNPIHWESYYHGSAEEQAHARKYSLSDRSRYYWPEPTVQAALEKLVENLEGTPLPLSLVGQFLPDLYPLIRTGSLQNSAGSIILGKISQRLEDYSTAVGKVVP